MAHTACSFSTHIFVLEQLCRSEEQRGGFLSGERLADIEQVDDTCEECPALPWADRRVIEDASLLNDCGLVVIIGAETTFFVLFANQRHIFKR